ncbi:hypothetical protein V1517DRAFT_264109 [Lipomyces orientalis]|uniref:Uncharacterized protein n=1 Tax=Lipomyces orientalis TaxID=1233043 RepID=A0ACC3TI79_9ASCO
METKNEELIPPTLIITLPPIPPPSRPPTKEDVNRAAYLKNMVEETLSCLGGRSVADALVDLRNEMRAMREGFDRQFREIGGELRDLKRQFNMQLELTCRLVQSMLSGRSEVEQVAQSLRQPVIVCIEYNRQLTESGQPAMEVVFLDGSTPSSKGLPPLQYYHNIQELNASQARQYARGHGFGGTAAEIRAQLSRELGVLQPTETHIVGRLTCDLCFVFLWLLLCCFVFYIRQFVHMLGSRSRYTRQNENKKKQI